MSASLKFFVLRRIQHLILWDRKGNEEETYKVKSVRKVQRAAG
jgi:hypothetical protein